MIWLLAALGALVVVAVGLLAVGGAVRRTEVDLPPVVLEVHDAVDWIADRLPVEAASQLSRDDVGSVVGWYLEVFAEAGLSTEHGQELGDAALSERSSETADDAVGAGSGERVAPLDDALEQVVARGLQQADPLDAVSVAMVAELLGTYLREMGAFGPAGDVAGGPEGDEPRG